MFQPSDSESERLMNWDHMQIEALTEQRQLIVTEMRHKICLHEDLFTNDIYTFIQICKSIGDFVNQRELLTRRDIVSWNSEFSKYLDSLTYCENEECDIDLPDITEKAFRVKLDSSTVRNRLVTYIREKLFLKVNIKDGRKQYDHMQYDLNAATEIHKILSLFWERRYWILVKLMNEVALDMFEYSNEAGSPTYVEYSTDFHLVAYWKCKYYWIMKQFAHTERNQIMYNINASTSEQIIVMYKHLDLLRMQVCASLQMQVFDNATLMDKLQVIGQAIRAQPDYDNAFVTDIEKWATSQVIAVTTSRINATYYATRMLMSLVSEYRKLHEEILAGQGDFILNLYGRDDRFVELSHHSRRIMVAVHQQRQAELIKLRANFWTICRAKISSGDDKFDLDLKVVTEYNDTAIEVNVTSVIEIKIGEKWNSTQIGVITNGTSTTTTSITTAEPITLEPTTTAEPTSTDSTNTSKSTTLESTTIAEPTSTDSTNTSKSTTTEFTPTSNYSTLETTTIVEPTKTEPTTTDKPLESTTAEVVTYEITTMPVDPLESSTATPTSTTTPTTTTWSPPSKRCIFPYVYHKKMYMDCTSIKGIKMCGVHRKQSGIFEMGKCTHRQTIITKTVRYIM